MTRPIIRIHNTETNEIVDREMNDIEFEKYLADQAAAEAEATAKAEAAAKRQALLDKLGISEDEARLLLG